MYYLYDKKKNLPFYFLYLLFFLPVWVEESVGTLDLFLALEGIISIFHHKIYLLVFVKKKKKKKKKKVLFG